MERFTTFFTDSGVPKTGLTVTIDIRTVDGTRRVTAGSCTEVGGGFYVYNYDQYDADKVYLCRFDGSGTLGNTDRYKFGTNDLDNYTNKYSYGRAGIVVPNYDSHLKHISDQVSGIKMPDPYNDKQMRTLIKSIADMIKKQNHDDVIAVVDDVKQSVSKIQELITSIDARESVEGVGNSLQEVKQELTSELRDIAQELSASMDSKHMDMSTRMSTDLTPDTLASKSNDRIDALIQKIEEMFVAAMQKEMPDKILNKFEVKLSKKDDSNALKELEGMAD